MVLDEKFLGRMRDILGEEYDNFVSALSEESVRGVRVNETKLSIEDFLKSTALTLTPIEYTKDGFIPSTADGIGNTPEHHAGMFYVQDPGAMATVNALDIKRGWRVLDSCAAPGGKSSQIASKIGDEGFILSNEYVAKRAKIIVSNAERLGLRNMMVVSYDTAVFRRMFDAYFDLVLCDAPCSGEGMFRKYDEALTEWSEENVRNSAERQGEILNNLAPLVKDGGYLLYSTCTYSLEENEKNVSAFLSAHPDYKLVPVKKELLPYTSDGISVDGLSVEEAEFCRRFYPHKAPGEGQFIALMQRSCEAEPKILYKDEGKPLSKQENALVTDFFRETVKKIPEGRLIKQGESVVIVPHYIPIPKYSVFMSGVMVGEIKGARLIPHHQFFSVYGKDFKNTENLKKDDPRALAYLRGEEIDAYESGGGFCTILYENIPLGGGKASGGKIKNHYPKGLRIK